MIGTAVFSLLISGCIEVSANDQFACARETDGSLWCWGGNVDGELGIGTGGNGNFSAVPVQVTALGKQVTQVSTGDNGACAVLSTAALECWGANFHGNLGDGTTNPRFSPGPVAGLGNTVAEVSMGVHTCARRVDGSVWCWGYNVNGQLGNASNNDSTAPVRVPIQTAATGTLPVPAMAGAWASLLSLLLAALGYGALRREAMVASRGCSFDACSPSRGPWSSHAPVNR